MSTDIYLGIDDHEESIAVQRGKGKEIPCYRPFRKTKEGMQDLRVWVEEEQEAGSTVYAAYEAGPCGPGLSEQLESWGWHCSILAPHSIARSRKSRTQKCDPKDALVLLNELRNHHLAGSDLSICWQPDDELRDHRELERYRISLGEKITTAKNTISGLCRRYGYRRPHAIKCSWTKTHIRWLGQVQGELARYAGMVLARALDHLAYLQQQQHAIDRELQELSEANRYADQVRQLCRRHGVGILTAMVFLLELGNLQRFNNRRKLSAYIGLVPSEYSTGDTVKKGRITKCGPWRVRKVLNQAAWATVLSGKGELYAWYSKASPRIGKKKAIVGVMRKLAVRLWHEGILAA